MSNPPNNKYVSCIRINGIPILPPLIDPERRCEILIYKQQAITIEQRLNALKSTKTDANETITLKALSPIQDEKIVIEENQCAENKTISSRKFSNLCTRTFDVTEYSSDKGLRLIDIEENTNSTAQLSPIQNCISPKLIRSNSYVLDSASTTLLLNSSQSTIEFIEQDPQLNQSNPIVPNESNEIINPETKSLSSNHSGSTSHISDYSDNNNDDSQNTMEQEILDSLRSVSDTCKSEILHIIKKFQGNNTATSDLDLIDFNEEKSLSKNQTKQRISTSSNRSEYFSFNNEDDSNPIGFDSSKNGIIFENGDEKYHQINNIVTVYCNVEKNIIQTNGEKFPKELSKAQAASLIVAAARGYLVRRLLRTERVQNIIQTIKDSLLCALDLHRSSNMDQADIELHRRLIHQLSAACCAFHDVFFALSTRQKMRLIATDREKLTAKLEKNSRSVSRVPSAMSVVSNNTKSSRQKSTNSSV